MNTRDSLIFEIHIPITLIELIIIADDLTGAIEAGVLLARNNIRARILPAPDFNDYRIFHETDGSALVFNTESRHIGPGEASRRVAAIAEKGVEMGVKNFFKKTDSTLRGNVGSELHAVMQATKQQRMAFIPAHPKLKRFTRKCFHYLDQQLLHESTFAHDPLEPMTQSYIPDILGKATNCDVYCIGPDEPMPQHMHEGILVYDCQSEEELKTIAELLPEKDMHRVMAGSAAMVEHLPDILNLTRSSVAVIRPANPVLIINGSLNKISLEQVHDAQQRGMKAVAIPPALLLGKSRQRKSQMAAFLTEIQHLLTVNHPVILQTMAPENLLGKGSYQIGESARGSFTRVSESLGAITLALLGKLKLNTLIVFGGDTLMAIMRALSCTYITPITELLPGIAVSLVQASDQKITLLSKPGGYGNKQVITDILSKIEDEQS